MMDLALSIDYFLSFSLPYTEAALREILRFETLVPSSVPHRTTEDTTLAGLHASTRSAIINFTLNIFFISGFDIPKNTFALASIHALHFDKDLWKDPNVFRPERFLDFKGRLSTKKDFSLPFGAGRRLCAGETFARNTMFLCLAALLQNFNLKPSSFGPPDLEATDCGLTRIPRDFWIKLEAK